MENVLQKEIAPSSLIFRIHADAAVPKSPTAEREKGKKERNAPDGKWKTPIGFCCVFVKQIKHLLSHRRRDDG